ncbi:MAG: hypothetical protein R2865_12985 [Deinococcales bacterium]
MNQELEKTTKDLRENEKQLREALRESQENEEAAQTSAREANKQKAIATATRLSVQAVQATENPSQLNGYPDLGLLLAKEAGRLLIEEGEGEDKDSLIFNNQGRSLKASETIQKYLRQKSPILSLSYSPDGKTLASGSSDNSIILWDSSTGEKLRTLAGHTGYVLSVSYSPDGKTLASGSSDNRAIILWDSSTGEKLRTLAGHTGPQYRA